MTIGRENKYIETKHSSQLDLATGEILVGGGNSLRVSENVK